MRRQLLMFVATGLIAASGAALGQEGAEPGDASLAFRPQLEDARGPTVIPMRSMTLSSGAAVLCCRARVTRTLDCTVAHESRDGFGDFAKGAIEARRLTRASYREYARLMPGGVFPEPFSFEVRGSSPAPPLPDEGEQRALCAAAG